MTLDPNNNVLNIKQDAYDFIVANCSDPTDGLSISETICTNYERISNSHRFQQNGQFRGQAFEIIVGDALAKALSETPAVIRGHVSYSSQNAEIDVAIDYGDSVHGIFLKTSLRERWKQEDRDALLFSGERNHFPRLESALGHKVKRFTPWSLVYKEQQQMAPEQAVQYVRRRSQFFAGIEAERIMSVYDAQRMANFANQILS